MQTDPLEKRLAVKAWRQWRPAVVGCSVAVVFTVVMLVMVLVSLYKSPYTMNLAKCKSNIEQVGDALGRYAIKNDKYPDDIMSLVPDYIPKSVLRCPADKSKLQTTSYTYIKLNTNAPDDAILLTCEFHKLKSKFPGVILYYRKNGDVTVTPAPKEH